MVEFREEAPFRDFVAGRFSREPRGGEEVPGRKIRVQHLVCRRFMLLLLHV